MRRERPFSKMWILVLGSLAVLVIGPGRAESTESLTCPEFGGHQWALVSIVDDDGFALHETSPLFHKLPVEVQLMAVGQDAPEAAAVLLCMDEDSWSTGVASCGFPLQGVSP